MDAMLTLKLTDNRLAGELQIAGRRMDIREAVVEGDRLRFQANLPPFAGMVLDFDARVLPDKLEGDVTLSIEAVGRSQTHPWVARRAEPTGSD